MSIQSLKKVAGTNKIFAKANSHNTQTKEDFIRKGADFDFNTEKEVEIVAKFFITDRAGFYLLDDTGLVHVVEYKKVQELDIEHLPSIYCYQKPLFGSEQEAIFCLLRLLSNFQTEIVDGSPMQLGTMYRDIEKYLGCKKVKSIYNNYAKILTGVL